MCKTIDWNYKSLTIHKETNFATNFLLANILETPYVNGPHNILIFNTSLCDKTVTCTVTYQF